MKGNDRHQNKHLKQGEIIVKQGGGGMLEKIADLTNQKNRDCYLEPWGDPNIHTDEKPLKLPSLPTPHTLHLSHAISFTRRESTCLRIPHIIISRC